MKTKELTVTFTEYVKNMFEYHDMLNNNEITHLYVKHKDGRNFWFISEQYSKFINTPAPVKPLSRWQHFTAALFGE